MQNILEKKTEEGEKHKEKPQERKGVEDRERNESNYEIEEKNKKTEAGKLEITKKEQQELSVSFVRSYIKSKFDSDGWMVKQGLKFGVDFLLYEFDPDVVHAKYAVLVAPNDLTWRDVISLVRLLENTAKQLVIASVKKSLEGELELQLFKVTRWQSIKDCA